MPASFSWRTLRHSNLTQLDIDAGGRLSSHQNLRAVHERFASSKTVAAFRQTACGIRHRLCLQSDQAQ